MRERIAKLVGPEVGAKMVLGTFHSVCLRYLRIYGHLVGLKKGFGVADSADSQAIVARIVKKGKFIADARATRSRISSNKARAIDFEELRLAAKKNVDQQEFVTIFEAYELHLAISNLLDYDDILLRCVDLLQRHPECVSNVEAVLIDEFQDTNRVQFDLMRLFAVARKRVTTVGDPDQSIYGWRSAEIKNLGRMKQLYPDTLVLHLKDNYRSSGLILLAALEVIRQDKSKYERPLSATHCLGTSPALRKLPNATDEAQWIVSEIKRCISLTGHGLLKHSDFAILLRSASLSRQIESVMGKCGMPYRMVGGLRFFDRVEIKLVLDYLRVVCQPDNGDALARVVNVPSRRVSPVTMDGLMEEASAGKTTLWRTVRDIVQGDRKPKINLSKMAESGLTAFFIIMKSVREKLLDTDNPPLPHQILELIIKKIKLQEYLEKAYPNDHENRWANIEELMAQARDYAVGLDLGNNIERDEDSLPQLEGIAQEIRNPAEDALTGFLTNVALSTEIQREDESDEVNGSVERVTISTIHAAKGLEWPVVFIPALYEGSIPHSRAEDCDEERRLLYVAMTRAQALLYLSCPSRSSTGENSTTSHFVSTKDVKALLAGQGPSLNGSAITDICHILRREYPSEQSLLEGMRTARNIEDNLWPTHRKEFKKEQWAAARLDSDDPYESDGSVYQHDGYPSKRRNIAGGKGLGSGSALMPMNSNNTNIRTTMQNSSAYTVNTPRSGFMSASSHFQNAKTHTQREQKKSLEPTGKNRGCLAAKDRKDVKIPQVQGSLHALWGNQAQDCDQSARLAHQIAQPTTKSTLTSKTASSHELPPIRVVALGRSSHKLPPIRVVALGRSIVPPIANDMDRSERYVLLSSSPPPPDPETPKQNNDPASIVNVTDGKEVRPSSTFHTTSVARLQARGSDAPRKTLGVRRSMVPWSSRSRAGQPFVAPWSSR